MFKPSIMEDVFKFRNLTYNFRNAETLSRIGILLNMEIKQLFLYVPKFGKIYLLNTKSQG